MIATTSGQGVMKKPVSTCERMQHVLEVERQRDECRGPAPRTSRPRSRPTARTSAAGTGRSAASAPDDPHCRRVRSQPSSNAATSSATTSAGGALCAALPMPMMKRPRQLAVSAALRKSKACTARGVFGRVFRPITIAITPKGRLIANSHGQCSDRQDRRRRSSARASTRFRPPARCGRSRGPACGSGRRSGPAPRSRS